MAEDDGKDEPQGRRRRSSTYETYRAIPHEDDLARAAFDRAGFPLHVEARVEKWAAVSRWAEQRFDAAVLRRSNGTRLIIWLFSGLGLAAIGVLAAWLSKTYLP